MALTDIPSYEPTGAESGALEIKKAAELVKGVILNFASTAKRNCTTYTKAAIAGKLGADAATLNALYGQVRTMATLLGAEDPGTLPG